MNTPEQWFINQILSGLQSLYVLSLDRTPAADMISATADVWAQTLWSKPVDWQAELDIERMQKAFVELAGAVSRWPSPAEFLVYLPKRSAQDALPKPRLSDEQKRQVQAMFKKLNAELKTGGS